MSDNCARRSRNRSRSSCTCCWATLWRSPTSDSDMTACRQRTMATLALPASPRRRLPAGPHCAVAPVRPSLRVRSVRDEQSEALSIRKKNTVRWKKIRNTQIWNVNWDLIRYFLLFACPPKRSLSMWPCKHVSHIKVSVTNLISNPTHQTETSETASKQVGDY
jgi:hypothetical protein